MSGLRALLASLGEQGRVIVAVTVIVALLALAGMLVWRNVDLAPFWALVGQ